jgi:hypothetical protein
MANTGVSRHQTRRPFAIEHADESGAWFGVRLEPLVQVSRSAAGGAFSSFEGSWHPSRIDFHLPVRALSLIYRAKFRDAILAAGLLDEIPPEVWQTDRVVNSRAIGSSEASLKYLAPYVFQVVISNSRILKVDQRTVIFRYKKSGSERWRTLALDALEFIRRFLQHVLPTGFMKVRHYGFMNPNCSVPLEKISALIELAYGFDVPVSVPGTERIPPIACRRCGGSLRVLSISLPDKRMEGPG